MGPIELAQRTGISERTLRRDLEELREFGYEIAYEDGYQLQESFDLDGGPTERDLGRVYQGQLKLVRSQLPAALAEQVLDDVEALAPAALASLFAAAIERRLNKAT